MVRAYTASLKIGDIYLGTVTKSSDFGLFIEVKPGVEGLCHISQLSSEQLDDVSHVAKEGDELLVKIVDIDKQGRVKLSRKEALGQSPTFYTKSLT